MLASSNKDLQFWILDLFKNAYNPGPSKQWAAVRAYRSLIITLVHVPPSYSPTSSFEASSKSGISSRDFLSPHTARRIKKETYYILGEIEVIEF